MIKKIANRVGSTLLLLALLFSVNFCSKNDPTPPAPTVTAPVAPTAAAGTAITQTGFTANWNAVTGATDYRLDVSADSYTTFVTGFNNLTVTGTTIAVTGLTAGTTYKYRVRASNTTGASANSNDITVTTTAPVSTNVATLGGAAFTSTKSTVSDTGAGLEIGLGDATNKITLSLSDKTAGTYTAINTSTGRVEALNVSFTVLKDGVVYQGVTGSLVLTVNSDGTFSATFDGTLKSSTGQTLSMSGGKIQSLPVTAVPSVCRITSITSTPSSATSCDTQDSFTLYYNSDGKIAKASTVGGGSAVFSYDVAGKPIAYSFVYPTGSLIYEFGYTGTTLTSAKGVEKYSTSTYNYNYTFGYTGNVLTSVINAGKSSSGSDYTDTYNFTMTNGNATTISSTYVPKTSNGGSSSSGSISYVNFDGKKNPFALLAQLAGLPISFIFDGGVQDFNRYLSLNANNPANSTSNGVIGRTFTYTYNAQNYPTKILVKYSPSCTLTVDIVYSGCQ